MKEFDLIHHICQRARTANDLVAGSATDAVTIPPGDDMGAIRVGDTELLVAVDQVIAGVHFDRSASLEQIGRKAVTRNLSDVAAMGGVPIAAVASATLPKTMSDGDGKRLADAIHATGLAYGCPVIGGDVAMVEPPSTNSPGMNSPSSDHYAGLSLSVTVLAKSGTGDSMNAPIQRRGAEAGDVLYVTGELGGSLLEFEGRVHHLDFEPRLAVGQWLAQNAPKHVASNSRAKAMIDVSDGLLADVAHLCEMAAEPLVAVIEANHLPLRCAGLVAAQKMDHAEAIRRALTDGEDYELAFAASADAVLPNQIEGVPITRIGYFEATDVADQTTQEAKHQRTFQFVSVIGVDGQAMDLTQVKSGWEHGV